MNNRAYYSETFDGGTRYNVVELDGNEYTVATLALDLQSTMQGAIGGGCSPAT